MTAKKQLDDLCRLEIEDIKELATFMRDLGAAEFEKDGVKIRFWEPRYVPLSLGPQLAELEPKPGEHFTDEDLGFTQPEFLASADDPDAVKVP